MRIADELQLKLQYKRGFGAWTYHLRIPDTMDIDGLNLAPRKNEDKILSINKEVRDAIKKGAGDTVTVTLDLYYDL